MAQVLDDNAVVISGMSGLFPQSRHVKDLVDILYEKKNPISAETCRWKYLHPDVPNMTGNVAGLELFDAQFFKVHYRLGETMDPMCRKTLEMAYQAIYDAGLSPNELYGKKVGVYTGSGFSESEKAFFYVASSRNGFGIAGCCKSMFANRISYWLNAKGPSMSVDVSCCSSLAALEQAVLAMTRGECEAAIVGGSNVCLHPQASLHYSKIIKLSTDGKTKSFDENASGCCKSEAINVIFLQKAKDAKRVYAEVIHVKNEFNHVLDSGTTPQYGFNRDPVRLANFIKTFYDEAKVPPQDVEYVEAFGSATPEADKSELMAIEEVFCKNRSDPLLVGSVMSNIGYTEAASGISAIIKVLLAYHKGEIAANLNCDNPRRDVAAIRDGRMQIVTDHKKFKRSYTAVNGISVTGVVGHVLLSGHYKPKDLERYKSDIPHLVLVSARQDPSIQKIFEDLKSRPIDPEELALLQNIHQNSLSGHMGRGYTILSTNEDGQTISLAETISYFDDAKRPLWFVYSGMGSQWAGMGAKLMRMPIFAAAIERCRKVLEPKGVDIVHIITSPDQTIFDNILNSFVGIAAIQIGLTDVLTALGLVPDKIIGHSVGELGCAYADGCFTAEEMILSAYSRGLVSVQTPFIRGSMAAIGLGYQQVKNMLPPEIEVACHNSPESCTISGPAEIMKTFVAELTAKGIFAKEVPCSNIAYHSRYIAEAGPGLLKYLTEVIKNPKPRSERWLSTSVPEDKWNEPLAKYSSAEYHTNNLLNPVLFEETSRLIPANAVLVEIAPHGLLQAILKRSLPASCKHIPLTRRGHSDNVFMVLDAVGKLYMEGFNSKIQVLYPKIEFPVSTSTPMLSHLVEWAHHEKWTLPLYISSRTKTAAAMNSVISIHDDEHSYLRGHIIRGKNLYPFSAAIVAVWDTLAMTMCVPIRQLTVEFRDVHFYAQPPLHDQRNLRLSVALHRGTGCFEVMDDNRKVATGYVLSDLKENKSTFNIPFEAQGEMEYTSDEVYQMLQERDYQYNDDFRSIHKANPSFTQAQIIWNSNWVTFLDGMLQLNALRNACDTVAQPYQCRRMSISIQSHFNNKTVELDGKSVMEANVFVKDSLTRCGGVIIEDIRYRELPLTDLESMELKTLKFVPRTLSDSDIYTATEVFLQMVAENINKEDLHLLNVLKHQKNSNAFEVIRNVANDLPGLTVHSEEKSIEEMLEMKDFTNVVDLLLVQNLLEDENMCQKLYRFLPRDTFIISLEETIRHIEHSALYRVISSHKIHDKQICLLKWRPVHVGSATTVITVRSKSNLDQLTSSWQNLLKKQKIVVLSPYPSVPGLKNFVKKWRKETDSNVYVIMLSEKDDLDQLPELDLAYTILNNGVLGGEYYTSCRGIGRKSRGFTLRSGTVGDLDTLRWVEDTEPSEPGVAVTVDYAAINNLDVRRATGASPFTGSNEPSKHSYCMDFSGITDCGKRVMGIIPGGAASSRVRVRPELLWPVPEHWSLEDAVTVPSAYLQAFYCFIVPQRVEYRLKPGYTVLVHGGAGGLGQAAIAVALNRGCRVFTTVSDRQKKEFLMKLFPQLQEDHICNSRDTSFGDVVMSLTKGNGCSMVICCVQGELKNISMKVSGFNGMFFDVSQIPNQEKFTFGMKYLTEERNYMQVDFYSLVANEKVENLKKLQLMLSEGIAKGHVRPLSRVVYQPNQVSRAFRLVASSRHRGRVVLRLRDSDTQAQPRLFCSADSCHVIIFDDDTFGAQFANRLISRGARKLHLHSRNDVSTYLKKRQWENVQVEVTSGDLVNHNSIMSLLSKSSRHGQIEGVYVLTSKKSDQDIAKVTAIVENLDSATRKFCTTLRYFAVVSVGAPIGQNIYQGRHNESLPATTINLFGRDKSETEECHQDYRSWHSTMNTIEQAILSSQSTLLAWPSKKNTRSLVEEIERLAEIKLSKESHDVTLREMNVESTQIPLIQTFLQDFHNVYMEEEEILNLTGQKIQDLEKTITGSDFKQVRGLANFFSYVDPDELLATNEWVFLPTLISSGSMRDDDFDVTQKYLCIIPGMEGHYGRFSVVCERLKMPAIVLQPGLDLLHESIRETAERYAKLLLKKIELKNNYYLLGYEYGVLIALEIAAILEDHGLTGTVYCVGGTPEEFQATVMDQIKEYKTEEEFQDAVAKYMFSLMAGNTDGLDADMGKVSSWDEKVEVYVRTLLGKVPHSAHYARSWIQMAYTRISQMRTYKPQHRQLKSKLILLRASSLSTDGISEDTASLFQRYSKQPVEVYQLRAPLAESIYDLRCAAIINRHLDDDLQKIYNESNLCVSYLINPNTFMQTSKVVDLVGDE